VDVVWYGTRRQPEVDFIVAAGVDPGIITLVLDGADRLEMAGGDLLVRTGRDVLRLKAPNVYQEIAGTRRPVAGHYVLRGESRVGFKIADHDMTRPLVIDPVLVYSTFLGGHDTDDGAAIAVDASGHAYVTGQTLSVNFPMASGGPVGDYDGFVTKLDPSGTGVVYSTLFGGTLADRPVSIAVDAAGNVSVSGITQSTDFPITAGALQSVPGGGFVTRLDATGSAFYSTYLPVVYAQGIAVSPTGNVYVTGATRSSSFPTMPGAYQSSRLSTGDFDTFLIVLDAETSALVYGTYFGVTTGNSMVGPISVAVDASGKAFVTGFVELAFSFPDTEVAFPTTPGAFQTVFAGDQSNTWVAKFDPAQSGAAALVYSTLLSGNAGSGPAGMPSMLPATPMSSAPRGGSRSVLTLQSSCLATFPSSAPSRRLRHRSSTARCRASSSPS
jgi:hypothetical protein